MMDTERIDQELSMLKETCLLPMKIKKINKNEHYIEIKISPPSTQESLLKTDVIFIIHILPNYPYTPPRVFCTSKFSFPHICDGRDILEDILSATWVPQTMLSDVVNKLEHFLLEFLKNLQAGYLVLVGTYYLGEKYDLSLFESLPVFLCNVKEKVNINGKEAEFPKVMMISDHFFCLFDKEKWTKNNIHLSFWSNIGALVTIRKVVKGDTCRFFWKQKNCKKHFEMVLAIDPSNDVVNLILDKMQKFGINYKISKQNLEPKVGAIPPIDIEAVEEKIRALEGIVETDPDMLLVQTMMDLYEKASYIISYRLLTIIQRQIIRNMNIILKRFTIRCKVQG